MFFDLGELGVELALVLSSIAILTKAAGYWYGGLVVCAAGLVVHRRGLPRALRHEPISRRAQWREYPAHSAPRLG